MDIGFVDAGSRCTKTAPIAPYPNHWQPICRPNVQDDKINFSPTASVCLGREATLARYCVAAGMYYDQSFLNVPLFAVQQANTEIYATFLNDEIPI